MSNPSPPEPTSGEPANRTALLVAIAASIGVVAGCTAPWAQIVVFSVSGLDFGNWGAATLVLGVLACLASVTALFWSRTPFHPRWSAPVVWLVAVVGVACLTFAAVTIVRLLTIPKTNVFGVPIGAAVGWGLWLVAFSSAGLTVAASITATQIAKGLGGAVSDATRWNQAWRGAASSVAALIVVIGVVYAFAAPLTRGDIAGGGGSSADSTMPSFPSFFSPTTKSDSSTKTTTTTETTTSKVAGPTNPDALGQTVSFTFTNSSATVAATVLAVDQSAAPDAPAPSGGGHWVSADVKTCLNGTHDPIDISWSMWSAIDANDGNYAANDAVYNEFPTPQYPNPATVGAGECVRGSVVFPVADGNVVTKVKFQVNAKLAAFWSATLRNGW